MEISDKQLAANRANALKSKGPKTAEGRRNSSLNSTRHGILANAVVLKGESRERFFALVNSFHAEFQPTTPSECALVERMAVAQWRLLRVWAVETAGIEREVACQTGPTLEENTPTRAMIAIQTLSEKSRHLDLLSRYEHRFDRQHHRAIEGLKRLREERDAREARNAQCAPENAGAARLHQTTENESLTKIDDPISAPSEPIS